MSPSSSSRQAILGLLAIAAVSAALAADLVTQGERIYVDGLLPTGKPLTAVRSGDVKIQGADAACVACHRRSGMGSVEGDILISPITANYLFQPPDKSLLATMDPRRSKSFNMAHTPYDDASLGRALRDGLHVSGRTMHAMMPRYSLDNAAAAALTAYLHQLSASWSLGVDGDGRIHLATVVTADADPALRDVVVGMLRAAALQKNANTVSNQPNGRRHMVSAAEMVLGTEHKWQLDVWQLSGPAETWPAQLAAYHAKTPVFAVLSGLTAGRWQPVQSFCAANRVPCWFPLVDLPPAVDRGYSLYFSRGVLLEADALARYLQMGDEHKPRRLVQVFRDDEVGRGAAAETAMALKGSVIEVVDRPWPVGDGEALQRQLTALRDGDSVMLWLRPTDLALLANVPPTGRPTYLSAQMNGGEHGIPETWKRDLRLVYPFELPQKRALGLNYFYAWLRFQRIPLVNELVQSEVYFATSFLTDTLAEMLDNLYRDYLIERAENMIGIREGSKAETEARERLALRRPAVHALRSSGLQIDQEAIGVRQSTTVFPRLALGPGQRFASKGAYIVRFADSHADTLVAESDWLVP